MTGEEHPGRRDRRSLAVVAALVVLALAVVVSGRFATSTSSGLGPSPTSGAASSPASGPSSAPATTPLPSPEDLGTIALGGRLDPTAMSFPGSTPATRAVTFHVTEGGGRLRIALDLSNRDDCVELSLVDPSGITVAPMPGDYPVVCPHEGRSGQSFGIDVSADGAAAGRWRADVAVRDPRDLAARLRVTLEPPDAEGVALDAPRLPDLVPWLPWEFGFVAPASADPGTARDRDNGPGDPAVSCHPEEEPDDTRCLRFSAGVYNVGDGPMAVVFRDDAAYQHVYRGDATPRTYGDDEAEGRFEELAAGRGEWHDFHQHRHLAEFVLYELFLVRDAAGTLARIDDGGKHGYCTFSQQVADWSSAAQDPQYASFPQGPYCDAAMTLERGWGDLYRWQRPGQYLDYDRVAEPDGSMRAGRYLVRLTVDPAGHIAETDETNNVGYTLVEVVDGGGPGQDTVTVCEQGSGSDPWDPVATVVGDRALWAKRAADADHEVATCS